MSISRKLPAILVSTLLAACAARGPEPVGTAAAFFGGGGHAAPRRPRPARSAEGERLYRALCSSCHGDQGRGDTPLAADLDPVPADYTRCNFKYRSTPSGSLPRREDLERTIAVGIPGSMMPSFAGLVSDAALAALAIEVELRCDRFGDEAAEPPIRIGAAPLYEHESVARGRALYQRERCATCHGQAGRGDGVVAGALRDLRGRRVRPRDHTRGLFRSGFGRADIYRAFSTGLDGTPMPALPPAVAEAERWDLAHYVVSLSADRCRLLRLLETSPTWFEPARTWGLRWR